MSEDRQPDECQTIEEELETPPDSPTDLQARLEEAEREKDQFRTMALRSAADLDNYKKRAAREMRDERERANERLLGKLIELADNFSRAVDHLPEDAIDPSWFEGVKLVQRSLDNVLNSEGVARIEAAIGAPFDVREHEAVFFEPTDAVPEGGVARVVRSGYRLGDRILRPAQVSVARPLPQPETTQQDDHTPE